MLFVVKYGEASQGVIIDFLFASRFFGETALEVNVASIAIVTFITLQVYNENQPCSIMQIIADAKEILKINY